MNNLRTNLTGLAMIVSMISVLAGVSYAKVSIQKIVPQKAQIVVNKSVLELSKMPVVKIVDRADVGVNQVVVERVEIVVAEVGVGGKVRVSDVVEVSPIVNCDVSDVKLKAVSNLVVKRNMTVNTVEV